MSNETRTKNMTTRKQARRARALSRLSVKPSLRNNKAYMLKKEQERESLIRALGQSVASLHADIDAPIPGRY